MGRAPPIPKAKQARDVLTAFAKLAFVGPEAAFEEVAERVQERRAEVAAAELAATCAVCGGALETRTIPDVGDVLLCPKGCGRKAAAR